MAYLVLKYLHVLGGTVLLGTGIGIAYFMLQAHRSGDAAYIARTAGTVVLADFIFTATAVVAQPLTGILLARQLGLPLTEGWLLGSLILYWRGRLWPRVRPCRRIITGCSGSGSCSAFPDLDRSRPSYG